MSDNILRQLYRGDYCPLEKQFVPDKAYNEMFTRKTDLEDRFEDVLPEEMREEFVDYLHLSGQLEIMDEEGAFCEGVRFGIRLMECVYGERKQRPAAR